MNGHTKHFLGYISIAIVTILVGCSRQNEDTIEFLSPPTLTVVGGFPAKPIVSMEYKADKKATVEFLVGDTVLSKQAGLRPAKKNNQLTLVGLGFPVDGLRLRLKAESGASVLSDFLQVPLDVKTLVPFNIVTTYNAVTLGESGEHIFVGAYRETGEGLESMVLAFDQNGRLSWTLPTEAIVTGIAQMSGDTLGLMSDSGILRVNFFGQPLNYIAGNRQISPDTNISIRVPTNYIVAPLTPYEGPSILLAEPEWRAVGGRLNSAKNIMSTNILSVSLSGDIEKRWSLFDLLDTQRVSQLDEADVSEYFLGINVERWAEVTKLKYARERNEIVTQVIAQGVVVGVNTSGNSLNWLVGDSTSWNDSLQPLFLKMSKSGADFVNPRLHGVYSNGDVLLGNSSLSLLGRYRINAVKRILEPVVAYSESSLNILANSLDDIEFVALEDDRLLILNKEAATISVIHADSNVNPWLAIEAYAGEQAPWRISVVASGITMKVPDQLAPKAVFNERTPPASAKQDSPLVGADPRGEPIDMAGKWNVIIDAESTPQVHELTLSQNSYSASGTFAGRPIQALIKGNVISFSLRNRSNGTRVLQRFRGVFNESHNSLQGQVDILIDDQLVLQSVWHATRITNNLL